jgi:leucyl-tRNA synthetase
MILGEDHAKMSKSLGNTVNPDEVIDTYGADALRLFEMFMGPLDADKPWSTDGIMGSKKFLERVYRMFEFVQNKDEPQLDLIFNQTIKKVSEDYEKLAFNTAISQMMIFVNEVYKTKAIGKSQARTFLKLLNPICPHITEEINETILHINEMLIYSEWPAFDIEKTLSGMVEVVVQVNGKLRAKLQVDRDTKAETIELLARKDLNVSKFLENQTILKIIKVPNKLINFVVQ